MSNAVTNIDSVTKFGEYVDKAKELGMKSLAFSEHGSVMEWWHKKCAIEEAGMKYIHAVEAYLTESLDEKIRDNYHCILISRNYDGFLELNRMVSKSFCRTDNHFYYVPRISFDELFSASENIIVTSACVGGVFGKGGEDTKSKFLRFLCENKDRCFLEIGHHLDDKQVAYNKYMLDLSNKTGLRLIAGTDTHVLNETHEKGRSILQRSKSIIFDGEDKWDLKFKSYDELISSYRMQCAIPEDVYLDAIENTNVMAEMVESFELDRGTKYPKIYDNPEETFRNKIDGAIKAHPYALKNHSEKDIRERVEQEFEVYKATKSIDFMLMQTYLREWEVEHGIQCGYGRGSVSGSMIAYLLGITQMDSMKFNLNFFRFMNPSRVTNADVDSDYSGKDRDAVKQFLLRDRLDIPNIRSAEIITFNTIAIRGAIRDVCRALYKEDEYIDYIKLADEICDEAECDIEAASKKYPDVFEYVDIINGTIVSVGTHPSGVLVSDLNVDETIGMCSIKSSDYQVSMLNMKELDDLMYVKLDILGLDNLGVINDTCRMLGIERLTPDNTDMDDMDVWKSIRDDTTLIFQWESNSAAHYLKQFMSDETLAIASKRVPNFSPLKWMSFGNGLIRPACASFRDSVAKGEFYDNGFDELNKFLAQEAGRIAMQETIMQFLVRFCGYSDAESDTVRRGIAKKKGTDKLIPEIERRFIEFCTDKYKMSKEDCEKIIKPFITVILDASAYAFSWNHSDSYSAIGYICGFMRYYYPLEFLTSALNTFDDNEDKTAAIVKYASKVGIKVIQPKFGYSKSNYFCTKDKNVISKGMSSIKYISKQSADELYELSEEKEYDSFSDLLYDITHYTNVDSRQVDILIKTDFFSDFGNQRELFSILSMFRNFNDGDAKKIKRESVDGTELEPIIRRHATWTKKDGTEAKNYTLTDVRAILDEYQEFVYSRNLDDLSVFIKVRNYKDIMGYPGYVSGKEVDRNKLYVKKIFPVKRRKDGQIFAYNVLTQSIGSGKESSMTVFKRKFDEEPFKEDDLIACRRWERDGKYFRILDYEKIYV